MKERTAFQCEYCGMLKIKKETMERHEKYCVHNPNGKGCYNCKFCYLSDYDADPYSKKSDVPVCYKDEEPCVGRMKKECNHFVRAATPYYLRTEQELDEE